MGEPVANGCFVRGRTDNADVELRAGIERLRRDLVDLAFVLELRGAAEAADLATSVAARLDRLGVGRDSAD